MRLPPPLLLLAIIPPLLLGCSGKQLDLLGLFQDKRIETAFEKADALVDEGKAVEAAAYLWEFAPKLAPPERQIVQVRAAEILLDAGHPLGAHRYLLETSEQGLEGPLLLRKRAADAGFYRQTDQPGKILAALPEELVEQGDEKTRMNALDLLAYAFMAGGELDRGIETHLRLYKLLNREQRPESISELWTALLNLDPVQVQEKLASNPDRKLRPWLELAALATPLEVEPERLERRYAEWRGNNRRWPLPDSLADDLRARWEYLGDRPEKVALLLPLTGDYAKAGRAVKKGFLGQNGQATTLEFTVVTHNTDQSTDILGIYTKAVADEDVDLVIGPLLKREIDALLASGSITVPTISLNYASAGVSAPTDKLFQFGLLPENEAAQAAHKIWEDGHRFIAVLAPDDEWGERLYRTFEAEYTALGGTIRAVSRYDPSFVDYAVVIESLFQLDQSRERHRLVSAVLDEKPRFNPRAREDLSAAMLFADHSRAVMIFPQMKFHYLDKLPTYATSHAYKPGTLGRKRDLDGLIYCDVPAIILAGESADEEAEEYPRLVALGADARALAKRFKYMQITRFSFRGLTGGISIRENQRLFRKLPWAQFSRGRPVPLNVL